MPRPAPSDFTRGLNPPQSAAVRHTEGPLLVLAGAGSGKTRVITQRIAHLIATGAAEADQILAVTFTNKAAAEMRERAGKLVGTPVVRRVTISTFHSFCLAVLRKDIEHLGYRRNFTIAGEGDARALLGRVVEDLGEKEGYSSSTFLSSISLAKNSNRIPRDDRPEATRSETEAKYAERLPEVYRRYQSALRAANSLDFDDLLLCTLELWTEHPELLERYQQQFRYVMVDEYQDTNGVQFELVRRLVDSHKNLCVVGDDDQSIYAWRGADARNILQFERRFPGAEIVTLDQNYRSTATILAAANGVITKNTTRHDKKLWSDLGQGRPIDWHITADEEDEAKRAAAWLKHIQARTQAAYRDFAVLYRSNLQSRNFEVAFRQAGIPYKVLGGQDFFERAEVKDIISYLKIIANPRDEAAFLRVVNMPRRGIGDGTLHKVHELCMREKLSLTKGLAEILRRDLLPAEVQMDLAGGEGAPRSPAEKGIREFLALLKHFRDRFRKCDGSLRQIASDLVDAIGYRQELERTSKNPMQASNRCRHVEIVLDALAGFEETARDEGTYSPTLTGFLDASHLSGDSGRKHARNEDRNEVTLMTIHCAKGLEFPFVFLVGVEEGLLPHDRSLKENGEAEERRLFYVALTRGMRHVTLFQALSRMRNGREKLSETSRFVKDIPEELLRKHIHAAPDMMAANADPPPTPPKKKRKPRAKAGG